VIDPSGYFWVSTQNAVKAFQTKNAISATGLVGVATRQVIKQKSCTSSITSLKTSSSANTTNDSIATTAKTSLVANATASSNAAQVVVTVPASGNPYMIGDKISFSWNVENPSVIPSANSWVYAGLYLENTSSLARVEIGINASVWQQGNREVTIPFRDSEVTTVPGNYRLAVYLYNASGTLATGYSSTSITLISPPNPSIDSLSTTTASVGSDFAIRGTGFARNDFTGVVTIVRTPYQQLEFQNGPYETFCFGLRLTFCSINFSIPRSLSNGYAGGPYNPMPLGTSSVAVRVYGKETNYVPITLTGTSGQINAVYSRILGRDVDQADFDRYQRELIGGKSVTTMGWELLTSQEGKDKRGDVLTMSNDDYVNLLYWILLDRFPDAGGKDYFMRLLASGTPRSWVFGGIFESDESKSYNHYIFTTEVADPVTVIKAKINAAYQLVLKRNADPVGLASYQNDLSSGAKNIATIVWELLSSSESTALNGNVNTMTDEAYVRFLYTLILNRSGDASGIAWHVYTLQNGASRQDVLASFLESPESKTKNPIFSRADSISSKNIANKTSVPTEQKVLGASTVCLELSTNFHRGKEGEDVTNLQSFLISQGFLTTSSSGFYGDMTVEAVKDYQKSRGLKETGMVYDLTREAISQDSCN
jgi:hypothetical protein